MAATGTASRSSSQRNPVEGNPRRIIAIQRSRILKAAIAVIGADGVSKATVAQIVMRSGVSRRTFYDFFADYEDCCLAAFEDALAQASRRAAAAYDPRAKWTVRIRSSLTALLRFFEEEPVIARVLVVESLAGGPRALARRSRALAQIAARIDEGASRSGQGEHARLTADGVVGAVLAILHDRLLKHGAGGIQDLVNPLVSTIVLPYRGSAAARQELTRTVTYQAVAPKPNEDPDPWHALGMRLTYRTVTVLNAIALSPGSSNRQISNRAGIGDQGQISRLLRRLQRLGLIQTDGRDKTAERGESNAWTLTTSGQSLLQSIN